MKWRIAPLGVIGLTAVIGINAWLLTVIATEFVYDDRAANDKVDWNVNLSAPAGTVANRKPIEAYRQILARPVFFKSREPFVPPPPPPPPAAPPAPPPVVADPGLVLGGVMIKSDIRKAYLSSRANTGGAWISEGGDFMGWQLRSISGAGAKLEQAGRSIDLRLYPQD
jgi:hypothetical protein